VTLCLCGGSANADPILWGAARSPVPSDHGTCLSGAFCDVNQDTSSLFTGKNTSELVIDDTIYFGVLTSATRARPAGAAASVQITTSAIASAVSSAVGIVVQFSQRAGGGTSVPEPVNAILIAAGCTLLGVLRRRAP
jgi:hypothetical protein